MDYSKIYQGEKYNSELLKKHKWLKYLAITQDSTNRIITPDKNLTLSYVIRTLGILNTLPIDDKNRYYVSEALKWSEVAKTGSNLERMNWKNKGYLLDIHNLSSAKIYMENSTDDPIATKIIYTLIATHGLIGQNILGEVPLNKNFPLNILIFEGLIDSENLKVILNALNECVIAAKSYDIWKNCKEEVALLIDTILNNNYAVEPPHARITKIKKSFALTNSGNSQELFINNIFSFCEMWFVGPIVNALDNDDVCQLFHEISNVPELNKVKYITFKPFLDVIMTNDKVNIYTLRVIEKYLQHTEDVSSLVVPNFYIRNMVLNIDFILSPVCKSLINFCVDAERVGLLSFEKAISLLFDTLGLKKDKFDRLNNEKEYLSTMNTITKKESLESVSITEKEEDDTLPEISYDEELKDVLSPIDTENEKIPENIDDLGDTDSTPSMKTSTKLDILNHIKGNNLMDVGSGGGVLLDLLEIKYPEAKIEGIDISSSVIKELTEKKINENHKWNVLNLNIVYEKSPELQDTIIFSSILHEIFSYETYQEKLFNIESVKSALKNAYDSLNKGGRIIIRDGIMTNENKNVILRFNFKNEGLKTRSFFNNFLKDFKGLPNIKREITKIDDFTYSLNVNLAREFLYTFTWGINSYPHEVKEQFGYFTLLEYKEFLESIGFKIIKADSYLEHGYEEHLLPKLSILGKDKEPILLPDSTCFIVAEKGE